MAKCDTCAYKALQNGACPVFKADMTGHDGCPYHSVELNTCDICGSIIFGKGILEEDEGRWHILCNSCLAATRCKTCVNQYCAFMQDKNCKEEPYVMVQQRQGNVIMQTQALNPKRVEATCRKGCPCFNEDGLDDGTFCGRQNECGCSKYKTNWRN